MRAALALSIFTAVLVPANGAQSFDYDDLTRLIQSKDIRSIEDLLPLLPESLRAGNALVYDSRSTLSPGHPGQEASPDNPRAILFGGDAKLMLTFNGDPKQAGFNTLEIVQFRDDTKSFELRQITFSQSKGKPEFSGKNPLQCLECHGSDPRPIWDAYSLWPGVFGSDDNALFPKEVNWFKAYKKRQPTHSRYRHIPPPEFPEEGGRRGEGFRAKPNTLLGVLTLWFGKSSRMIWLGTQRRGRVAMRCWKLSCVIRRIRIPMTGSNGPRSDKRPLRLT